MPGYAGAGAGYNTREDRLVRPLRLQPILTSGLVTVLALLAMLAGMFEAPERATLVARLLARGPMPPLADTVIVAIDEAALERFGQMPWDRRRFAELLDRLHADGARAVGLDVAFHEPARDPAEDRALAAAIARMGRVILPAYRAYAGSHQDTTLFKPLPEFAAAAAALGLVQFNSDQEAMTLGLEPVQSEHRAVLPIFGLALARAAGLEIPEVRPGYLNPLGPAHHFRELSFGAALAAPPGTFRDRIVLVGATARGLPDTNFVSPFQARGPVSGVELHATALSNLATGTLLHRLPIGWNVLGLLLIGLVPGSLLASDRPGPLRARLLALLGLMAALVVAAQALLWTGWWIELMPGLVILGLSFVVGLALQHARLLGDRNRMLEWYAADLAREAKRERERIDGELHDEAQQLLIALTRDLRRVRKNLQEALPEAGERLAQSEALGKRILDEIMRVRKDLMPHTLSRSGLKAAVEEMAGDYARRQASLAVHVEVGDWPERLDPVLESELYWLIKESLNNAAKHAQARRIRLKLERRGPVAVVGIADDGRGFAVPDLERAPAGPEHSGLHRMWLRARALRGGLSIESTPGRGTRLELRVPVEGAAR